MPYLPQHKTAAFFTFIALTGLIVIAMLYFGIRLKGYRPTNNVRWSKPFVGIAFNRFSVAYTDDFFKVPPGHPEEHPLVIEMAIAPSFPTYPDFRFLLVVHDGDEQDQLLIGQWRSSLVIMNGDDYSNRRRRPKLYLKLNEKDKGLHLVTIFSSTSGTKVYLDGELKHISASLVLSYPRKGDLTRLVVGNSLNGNRPWVGTVSGLAFYERNWGDADVERHFQAWRVSKNFNGFQTDTPRLLYAFDEGGGHVVRNKMGDGLDLKIPANMIVLKKKVLSWPHWENVERTSVVEDVALNLVGFVPLGFILTALLGQLEGIGNGHRRWIVVLAAFAFSLFIEIAQVWIPSRDSSLLDLCLNTIGGFIGVVVFEFRIFNFNR